MPKKIVANPKRELDPATLPEYLTTYLTLRDTVDELTKKLNGMKATLMAYLDEHGTENQSGHKVAVIDGIATITRQRSVSETFLESQAERWLKDQGIDRNKVVRQVTIEEFDYDTFMALLYEAKTPQATVDQFYDRNEQYSFRVTGRNK